MTVTDTAASPPTPSLPSAGQINKANWPMTIGTNPLRIVGPPRQILNWSVWPDDHFTSASVVSWLEYLNGPQRVDFMHELYRVLKLGAQATITVPYYSHPVAFSNPFLQWPPFSEASFKFFDRLYRKASGLEDLPITCDFDVTHYYEMVSDWLTKPDQARVFGLRHYWGVCPEIVVTLTKRWVADPPAS